MALDGMFLHLLCNELSQKVLGARVDKIYQPSREEMVIALRGANGTEKLLLSAAPNGARAHLTDQVFENPKQPPMFCMLLRKHLGFARLTGIRQFGMDRILFLEFDALNELGDAVKLRLALEIMGRHSNIILIGQDGKIIDAVKRVDAQMSSVRQVLPGMVYSFPPLQEEKLNLLNTPVLKIVERVAQSVDTSISDALLASVVGMSPLICREGEHFAAAGQDVQTDSMTDFNLRRLEEWLLNLRGRLENFESDPVILRENDGRYRDFTFMRVYQFEGALSCVQKGDLCTLLDEFYREKDLAERMKQRSLDLVRVLSGATSRITKKIAAQQTELAQCKNRNKLKEYGDLISANIYKLDKGQRFAMVENYYDESLPTVKIYLEPALTPSENAQKYYKEYRKAATAEKKLTQLLSEELEELQYLDSVSDLLARASKESELNAIREELQETGYIKKRQKKEQKPQRLEPIEYTSSDGFSILVGRNNVQNDRLTLKDTHRFDLWFHAQKIPGSHTVVVCHGKDVPARTLEQAAAIAAFHSRARNSSQVPVDYTAVKNVKKPPGAKPGRVIYENYSTVVVTPDQKEVELLLVKKQR